MSNARANTAAEINLEEFERRLRATAAPQGGVEDPLAELTRLVDTIGFERTPSERALEATRPPKIAAKPAPAPPPPPPPAPVLEILPPDEPQAAFSPRFEPPAAPLLRPSFAAIEESVAPAPPPPDEAAPAPYVAASRLSEQRPRGRNWGLKVGGLVAASIVLIAAVSVFKVGRGSRSGAPPLILASTAPTKVAPPSEETVRTANESGSLLTRDTAQPTPTPPKLVAPPEAPVDLAARPQPTATATATAGTEALPVARAPETPIVAKPPEAAAPAAPVSSDPSRVKTISVRPDGTLISSGFEASTAAAPPPPAPMPIPTAPAVVDAEAATPAPALPTKLSPPKSAARVVSKSDTTAPADEGAGPVPVKPKKPKPTATPTPAPAVAEAEPKTDDAAPAEAAGGGGYSVQIAAPNNRADADELVKKAQAKYADAIGGATVGVRKADRHGDAIYRVRVLNLTRAQASAMCAKIKSTGGDCFTAKN